MSTRALRNAFPEAKEVIGIDTSPEMVSMAQAISIHNFHVKQIADSIKALLDDIDQALHRQSLKMKKARNKAVACLSQATFSRGNAEHTPFPANSFDLVTIM
jgi:ubiquinone/menaquinone biosynthesis C-methylase UbiE